MENNFWTTIETDLCIEIPNFIKNSLNLCGFNNPLSFKEFTDEDILIVEKFMREKWAPIMEEKIKQNPNAINMPDHFGTLYANNPKQFDFMPGEKKFIKVLVAHVQKIIESIGLKHFIKNNNTAINIPNKSSTNHVSASRTRHFLDRLKAAAEKNETRKLNGYRYDCDIKLIATYLRLITGPLAYDTIQRNLDGCLPALSSVNRYIAKSSCNIVEGVLRSNELLMYLEERNLSLDVSISEDQTRIVSKVQYDSKTNQIVGFTLSLNKSTGLPIPFTYNARSSEEIMDHFAVGNPVSSYLNVIMAQPLMSNVPAFCLLAYGCDNKFKAIDVDNRWNHIETELASLNIRSWTFSSDSDPRYNSAMRQRSKLGQKSIQIPKKWFFSSFANYSCDFQDPIHIATKLRNRLLQTSWNRRSWPFGRNNFVTLKHLYFIMKNFSKDRHELTKSILNPIDKQNFRSVEKMISKKVTGLLKASVRNSSATIQYLEMIRDVTDAFRDKTLTPLERIQKIWFRVFILRLWRRFILKYRNYNLKDHFLTMNCYVCIELNAHSLVQIILNLREVNKPELFLPHLFGSQQCESIFRQMRSMTSTFSTIANCSTKEALSRLSKIQIQNDIMEMTSNTFKYPRLGMKKENVPLFSMPSLDEINIVIDNCASDAIEHAIGLNLITKSDLEDENLLFCKIKPSLNSQHIEIEEETEPIIIERKQLKISDFDGITLKNFAGNKNSIDESSPFTELNFNDKTRRVVVKKSSFVWLLRRDCERVSSDRLRRVQCPSGNNHAVKKNRPKRNKNGKTVMYPYKRPMKLKM